MHVLKLGLVMVAVFACGCGDLSVPHETAGWLCIAPQEDFASHVSTDPVRVEPDTLLSVQVMDSYCRTMRCDHETAQTECTVHVEGDTLIVDSLISAYLIPSGSDVGGAALKANCGELSLPAGRYTLKYGGGRTSALQLPSTRPVCVPPLP